MEQNMKEKMPHEQIKEQEATIFQKALRNISVLFCGEVGVDPAINRAIYFNTYCQIWELLHIVFLYTVFSATNNPTFATFESLCSGVFILICIIPRSSKKHIVLEITCILFAMTMVGSTVLLKILIQNYITFTFYCDTISGYSLTNPSFDYQAGDICLTIKRLYQAELGVEASLFAFRVVYLILVAKGYVVAKIIFDEDEKKKRRKDKYNELLKAKNAYNEKRKI